MVIKYSLSAKKSVKKRVNKSVKKSTPIVKKTIVSCDAVCKKAKDEMMSAHKNIISSMRDDTLKQKNDLARLQRVLDEKDNKLRLCTSNNSMDDSEVKKLRKVLSEKKDILQKIGDKLRDQQSSFDKHLKEKVQDATDLVKNEYKTSMDQLRSQLNECTKAGGLCDTERSELKKLHATFEQELKNLKDVHISEMKDLQSKTSEQERYLADTINEYRQDNADLERKRKEFDEMRSEKERELADIINEYRQDNADLERKREEFKNEREEFQRIRQQFDKDHAEFKNERAAFEKSIKNQNASIVVPTVQPTTQPPPRSALLDAIQQGTNLRNTSKQDGDPKPKPSFLGQIQGGIKLKPSNKDGDPKPKPSFLGQIQGGIKLKPTNKDANPITNTNNALLTKIKAIGDRTKSEEDEDDDDESWKFRERRKTKKSVRKTKKSVRKTKKSVRKTKKSVRKTKKSARK